MTTQETNDIIALNHKELIKGGDFAMITKRIANYIKNKGISVAKISEVTGIGYQKLYRSLNGESRELRADELLLVCRFLDVNPYAFMDSKTA